MRGFQSENTGRGPSMRSYLPLYWKGVTKNIQLFVDMQFCEIEVLKISYHYLCTWTNMMRIVM